MSHFNILPSDFLSYPLQNWNIYVSDEGKVFLEMYSGPLEALAETGRRRTVAFELTEQFALRLGTALIAAVSKP